LTVTENVQVLLFPTESTAKYVTLREPNSNAVLLEKEAFDINVGMSVSQLSVTSTEGNDATAVQMPVEELRTTLVQLIRGASRSTIVTVKLHEAVFAEESFAQKPTVVVPSVNWVPFAVGV